MPKPSESARRAACAVLLAGPTVLAFFSGGFFAPAQRAAAIAAWLLLGAALALTPGAGRRPGRTAVVAVSALAALAGWTAGSTTWAPAGHHSGDALRLVLVYLPALAAGVRLARATGLGRVVEPALGGGVLVVVAYALAGRIVPGVVVLAADPRAAGRLEQPLTYWNAMGALAALGLVLAARVAADARRPAWVSASSAAACAPLGAGVALSYSRASIAVALLGLLLLVLLLDDVAGLRRIVLAGVAAVAGAAATLPFEGVRTLGGSLHARELQGAVFAVLLAGVMSVAAGLALRAGRRAPRALAASWRRMLVAAGVAVALAPYAIALTASTSQGGHDTLAVGATTARLTQTGSNRRLYWDVAWRMFRAEPVHGRGADSFAGVWLRERTVREGARNAHSLALETAAELGLVGLLLLGAILAAVAIAARRAVRSAAPGAVGTTACLGAWLLHAGLDWDWQVPALTLVAVICAGTVLGAGHRAASRV